MASQVSIEEPPPSASAEGPDAHSLAHGTIKYYAAWSFGAGVVPIPLIDMLLVIGVQVQMLRKISDIYGVKFSEHLARNLIAALLGGLGADVLSFGVVNPLVRGIPGVGHLLQLLTMPAFSAASTYAVGRVFVSHFESGGTLLTFKPEKVRDQVRKAYETARSTVTGRKAEGAQAAA